MFSLFGQRVRHDSEKEIIEKCCALVPISSDPIQNVLCMEHWLCALAEHMRGKKMMAFERELVLNQIKTGLERGNFNFDQMRISVKHINKPLWYVRYLFIEQFVCLVDNIDLSKAFAHSLSLIYTDKDGEPVSWISPMKKLSPKEYLAIKKLFYTTLKEGDYAS